MEGREPPDHARHKRRRAARWLLAAGGILLIAGVIIFIVGLSTSSAAKAPSNGGSGTCPPHCSQGSTASASPSGAPVASSPWNATNIFGGITAITGLIGALTGALTLQASRHQAPATYYLMPAQAPAVPPGAVPVPGPSQAQAQAVTADPASADKTGPAKPGEDNQPP